MKKIVLLLYFLMIMGGVSSYAQDALVGAVHDSQSNPIPSVAVTVKACDGRLYSGYTDKDGIFAIECPQGDVVITAKKDSYESCSVKSTYKKNEMAFQYIQMKKSNQCSSSNNSSSNGSVVGAVIAGAAGAAIIGGVASAIEKSSSSSSSSNSNNSNKKTGPEPGIKKLKNVEIMDVKYKSGSAFGAMTYAYVRIRNMNSYSVVARVQCRFFDEWNGYAKEVTIPAGAIREVEVSGPQGRYVCYDARITSVD